MEKDPGATVLHVDDKKLVQSLLAGDERAFARFFDEYFSRLYRFAITRLSDDPDAAREVVQLTLTHAVRRLDSYRGEAALFTWLCTICRNETSDWLRKRCRYRALVVPLEDLSDIEAAVDSIRVTDDERPDHLYQRAQRLRLIQVALDRLPARYGDALEWKYIDGYSVREIAARLEIGQEAAQSLLARAKRSFGEVYAALLGGTGDPADGLL